MIAHHQHWLLAFTALLSRNGPDRRARCSGRIGDTHSAGELLDVPRSTLPEVVVSIGPSAARRPVDGAKGHPMHGTPECQPQARPLAPVRTARMRRSPSVT